jgi:hypothetical protein
MAESVIGLYKNELIHPRAPWKTVDDVELSTLGWVHWWNTRRLLGPIGHAPPVELEQRWLDTHTTSEPDHGDNARHSTELTNETNEPSPNMSNKATRRSSSADRQLCAGSAVVARLPTPGTRIADAVNGDPSEDPDHRNRPDGDGDVSGDLVDRNSDQSDAIEQGSHRWCGASAHRTVLAVDEQRLVRISPYSVAIRAEVLSWGVLLAVAPVGRGHPLGVPGRPLHELDRAAVGIRDCGGV